MGIVSRGILWSLLIGLSLATGFACAPKANHGEQANVLPLDSDETARMINSESVGPNGAVHERAVLGLQMLNSRGEYFNGCSTVLIRSDVVLLAGHCFDPKLNAGVASMRVQLTHDLNKVGDNDPGSRQVVKTFRHPQYDSHARVVGGVPIPAYDHDLAIALLDRPYDSSVVPQQIAAQNRFPTTGMSLVTYGFGRSADWGDARGTPTALRFRTRQRGYVVISRKIVDERNYTRADSKSHLCEGDSGGPAFLLDKKSGPVVIGINSANMGTVIHALSGMRKCDGESIIQPIAPMRNWIDGVLKEIGR